MDIIDEFVKDFYKFDLSNVDITYVSKFKTRLIKKC